MRSTRAHRGSAATGGLPNRGPQECLDLRPDVRLPVTTVLRVSLPEIVGEQQRMLGHRADDVGGAAKKAADGDGQKRIGLCRAGDQQALLAA